MAVSPVRCGEVCIEVVFWSEVPIKAMDQAYVFHWFPKFQSFHSTAAPFRNNCTERPQYDFQWGEKVECTSYLFY